MPMTERTDHPAAVPPHRVRVRYCETDRMGVAHHGSYVAWLEEARTEWLRARGKTYRQMEDEGNLLQVVEMTIRYRQSITYDDEVLIAVSVSERGRAAVRLAYDVRRAADGSVVASAETRLACVGRDGRLRRLPEEI